MTLGKKKKIQTLSGNIKEALHDDNTWVTVFGFTPKQSSFVLKQFCLYGEILEHKIGNGNWMHLK
jgi:hypothetical protein